MLISHLSNDDLRARSLAAFPKLALWLLRYARDPVRLLESLATWASMLVEVERAPAGIDAFAILLNYMSRVVGETNPANLQRRIHQMHQKIEAADEDEGIDVQKLMREVLRFGDFERAKRVTLRKQLTFKFQLSALDERYLARLKDASPDELDRYLERVVVADSLAAVFED